MTAARPEREGPPYRTDEISCIYCGRHISLECWNGEHHMSGTRMDAVDRPAAVPAHDLTLTEYPNRDACATTGTPRFHRVCRCPTYPANWGACDTWEKGANGLCAFCDHARSCHRALPAPALTVEGLIGLLGDLRRVYMVPEPGRRFGRIFTREEFSAWLLRRL